MIKAASGELGWWGTYIKTVEEGLFTLHDILDSKGVPFPYGTAIFCFVVGVKVVTLPLNWNQLASAASMKSVQPQQELVRKWYADNKNMQNQEVGFLFERLNVNPLAGCLPALAQIPVFLGVYYSVTAIAKAKIFSEGFLWIPNLSGPISDRTEGLSWLTEGWVNGAPKLGWEDTLLYLSIPLILVVSQTVSLQLLGSFDALGSKDDKSNDTAIFALRLLPFMIGWFAMNAPSGLGLYWVFNNVLTTAQTVVIKKVLEKPPVDHSAEVSELIDEIGPRRSPVPWDGSMKVESAAPMPSVTASKVADVQEQEKAEVAA